MARSAGGSNPEVLERLQIAFKESGARSGREFSEAVGLKPTSGAKTLSGATALTPTLANSIELIYGIRAAWLLEGEEPMRADPRERLEVRERRMLEFVQGTMRLATLGPWMSALVWALAAHLRSPADFDEVRMALERTVSDDGERRGRVEQWQRLRTELESTLRSGAVVAAAQDESMRAGIDWLLAVFEAHRDGRTLPHELAEVLKQLETLEEG